MRARAFVTAAVVTVLLAAGCSSSPAEEVGDWYSGGGEKQIKQMAEDAARVSEVSTRTLDVIGTACQDLAKHVPAAEALDPIPDKIAQMRWKRALTALREGASQCTAGAASKDEPMTGEGVRKIQIDGLHTLPDVTGRIRTVLDHK
ncbi:MULTISPECIES: hypothetical protein [unclassified Streptomyces]|uniref:hypothetical protein n=1 Tax=unclassified Streptomyces TaxID=2593676 RepID=UPI001BEA020E|nr:MULTISPECIES: hypothetical protein [unclassified Streptomyces]MBT2407625.1 hypothetical protein [Streptomyces sp. ISL-21]MBT2459063.1 hypothetical protein [Streptomyces sp. ISL-86]MBT2611619.1 hypothetical protein [Streptomyces sp. ISL-87]